MSAQSEAQTWLPWISFAAGSPARISVTPARALGSLASGPGSGASTFESFASFDLDSSSWRTSQRCLLEGWTSYSETWPRAGMMRSGTAYRLPPLAPLTAVTGSSSSPAWATPGAMDGEMNERLATWVARHRRKSSQGIRLHRPLRIEVQMWPTACAADSKSARNATSGRSDPESAHHSGVTLTDAIRLWPTAQAHDGTGPPGKGTRERGGRQADLHVAVGAPAGLRLNPSWVESLMGFPSGWTLCEPLARAGRRSQAKLSTSGKPRAHRRKQSPEPQG